MSTGYVLIYLTQLAAQRPLFEILKTCGPGDMKAMLQHYQQAFKYSGVDAQDLVQKMGREAAERAQPEVVSQIIQLGLQIDRSIMLAALKGCSFEIFEMLWRNGFGDVNRTGWWLDYSLLHAISARNHQMVEFCLDEGANPNSIVRLDGHRPLVLAAVRGSVRILKHLIKTGAVVKGSGAFEAAGKHGQIRIVKALILHQQTVEIARRRDVQQRSSTAIEWKQCSALPVELIKEDMTNAIILATEAGHEAVIELLLIYGVDPSWNDVIGKNALQVAESKGNAQLATKLKLWIPNFRFPRNWTEELNTLSLL
ncbi:hypothetical protein MMC07_000282 [Pseudocyphellaria aurata]|nr:hypothetical protein [Pseudocyphellaria aurata]